MSIGVTGYPEVNKPRSKLAARGTDLRAVFEMTAVPFIVLRREIGTEYPYWACHLSL